MTTSLEKDPILCPHCGAEPLDNDDLCRFCGKAMVPSKSAQSTSGMVSSGLRSLNEKGRPMTEEELDETLISADFSNPANPIWDD